MSDLNLHVIVLAGGKGTRFWPLSTPERPKQFLNLFGDRTLIQHAVDRVLPLVGAERVWISTDASLEDLARRELPELPDDRFVIEPVGRNTLPGIALACASVNAVAPDAVVAIVTADHLIREVREFRALLTASGRIALNHGELLTFGIVPTRPETGYGYVKYSKEVARQDAFTAYRVERFTEKPERSVAEAFLREGHYLWNSGMFVWRLATFFEAMRRHQPTMTRQIEQIVANPSTLTDVYPKIESISVDYGLMELADNILTVPADIGWDDVGNWESVWTVWERDGHDNAVRGEHVGEDTRNCLIFGVDKPIVTLGIDNLIVVETEDAVLICPRDRAQEVRGLAARVLASNGSKES
ncbi:MAG: mannose-1-phosphate guanylyltransferase [Candidatus Poribacteria bacterium]|nr:mannose-1-phosphate guanylyltransferase [Candidatus Poribacteria bacterium]